MAISGWNSTLRSRYGFKHEALAARGESLGMEGEIRRENLGHEGILAFITTWLQLAFRHFLSSTSSKMHWAFPVCIYAILLLDINRANEHIFI